jgi:hypothetical protein
LTTEQKVILFYIVCAVVLFTLLAFGLFDDSTVRTSIAAIALAASVAAVFSIVAELARNRK